MVAADLNFDFAAVSEAERGAEVDLGHEFEVGLAVKLAGAKFVGIRANDKGLVAGDQAALELDGFAEAGLPVVGILLGKDEGVGENDVFLGNVDVERAGDEICQAGTGLD